MKKCIGCGEILQTDNKFEKAYVDDLKKDYCFRCFKLKHYNDLQLDLKHDIKKEDVFKLIKNLKSTFVLIVDVLNIEASFDAELLSFLKDRDVIVIISKCDLLPHSISLELFQENLMNYLQKILKGIRVLELVLTSKQDANFKEILEQIVRDYNIQELCFIGYSNVGKSSLINQLLKQERLTTSYYLTTTLSLNRIDMDGYVIIDSPGFVNFHHAFAVLDLKQLKEIHIKKTIKPKIYQIYENQSYFINDLYRIDVLTKQSGSVVFYQNNDLSIHRGHYDNADNYMKKHCPFINSITTSQHTFSLNQEKWELVIDGIGFISFHHVDEVRIHIHQDIDVYLRKGII